ncbi:MAG: hypothetical protein K0B05_03295 [Bacteroidales bacterium]|nr:hypothetical protein [Bacteroidales bacterium]
MTRIKVFKISTPFSKLFIIFGCIFFVFGILLIINALSSGFDTQLLSGDWNSVIYTLQGILFISIGAFSLLNRKYFIEWDDNELRFLMPDTKKIEVIKFDEVISVRIRLFEIELTLHDRTRTLDLNNLQFEDLRKIKAKFENFNR